ncbi:MAG: site-specific DNA-methyltransferase [Candidatus Binatia bacterium]
MTRRRKSRPRILDPFAGVGTTLVQALLNGYDTVGFEINPYAALATKLKLKSPKVDLERLQGYCREYHAAVSKSANFLVTLKPSDFETRIPFFSPSIEKQVLAFLHFVNAIPDGDVADMFRLALGSVMVSFSNYTYEPSLGSRPGAGKPLIEKADVHNVILAKLHEMISDVRWIKERLAGLPSVGEGQIHNSNFMQSAELLPPRCVDLVVTSPPYMNNYHYVRNTRPQLYWLSLVGSSKDVRYLDEENFGKYWQTVRDRESIELGFEHPELSRTLAKLRQTREEKGPYGGPGWANYVAAYFNDCYRALEVLKRLLVRGAASVVVIGNSIIQGHEIRTDLIMADIAVQIGLILQGVQKIRTKRVGASITRSAVRRGDMNRAILYESAVIMRRK